MQIATRNRLNMVTSLYGCIRWPGRAIDPLTSAEFTCANMTRLAVYQRHSNSRSSRQAHTMLLATFLALLEPFYPDVSNSKNQGEENQTPYDAEGVQCAFDNNYEDKPGYPVQHIKRDKAPHHERYGLYCEHLVLPWRVASAWRCHLRRRSHYGGIGPGWLRFATCWTEGSASGYSATTVGAEAALWRHHSRGRGPCRCLRH